MARSKENGTLTPIGFDRLMGILYIYIFAQLQVINSKNSRCSKVDTTVAQDDAYIHISIESSFPPSI